MSTNFLYEKKENIKENIGITSSKRYLDHDFEAHTHDFFEIEFITSGYAIHNINGQKYEIKKGDIYIISPSDFHSLKVIEPLTYYNIMFSEQAVSPSVLYDILFAKSSYSLSLTNEEYHQVVSLFDLITKQNDFYNYRNHMFYKNLCDCIMIIILKKIPLANQGFHSSKNIYQSILYISRNFRYSISLEELALIAGLSRNYFCSLFKKTFGVTPVEYINAIRLNYAKNLIISTDYSITDVCYGSGFNSFSVFSKAFKKRYKEPPSHYRKMN